MGSSNLLVRAGQELTAELWNAFWRERRGVRVRAGCGVLVRETGDGTIISFRAATQGFVPHFEAKLSGNLATFGAGFVNGLEPRIEGRPITGILPGGEKDPKGAPGLELRDTSDFFDAGGNSWLALRVKVDGTGRLIQPDEKGKGPLELSIVQRKSCPPTDPDDASIGYHRIALLRRPAAARTGLGTLRQIAMFDYQHRTARQNGRWAHFFDPA